MYVHPQKSKLMSTFATNRRVALTGYPLMNELSEYFTMIDWACPGYFPDKRAFDREYTEPIKAGRKVGATKRQTNTMLRQACILKSMLKNIMHRVGPATLHKTLPPKLDMLIALAMPRPLIKLYTIFVTLVWPLSCCRVRVHRRGCS